MDEDVGDGDVKLDEEEELPLPLRRRRRRTAFGPDLLLLLLPCKFLLRPLLSAPQRRLEGESRTPGDAPFFELSLYAIRMPLLPMASVVDTFVFVPFSVRLRFVACPALDSELEIDVPSPDEEPVQLSDSDSE